VRRLLDHTSHTMTARYARLADTTIRQHWERAQKINIRGEPIDTTTAGPLADAAWMKKTLSRAKTPPHPHPRAARRRRLDETEPVSRENGSAQRILRSTVAEIVSTRQRMPDLP